ncbi:MAG: DUF4180 domain-containing protein [Pedobacter sp.]|uniref:DUF4180 domain-containing protein n=1 Tax=Pedobacter sp. TaxID=1411316 RepID=UPI00356944DA
MDTSVNDLLASKYNIKLSKPEDAITILETGLAGMIFTQNDIGKEFFDLKNGILGETFQKLVNYRFPIAVVLHADHDFGLRVTELAREHSKHPIIRFCQDIEEAKAWMTQIVS